MYYQAKDLDMCVAIISIDGNTSGILKTQRSMDFLSKNYPSITVMPENIELDSDQEISTPIYQGGNCITSMFDVAISKSLAPWVYLIFAGSIIRKKIDIKLSKYVEAESDVLFPVVDRIWNFIDGSVNGILINKNFHKSVGNFGSGNPLKVTKLNWAEMALEKGVQFKAIVGAFSI
jgi:hypothetical protein